MVLFFGLIRPYKGLEWLLNAATELQKSGEDVCFCIAGEPYTDWEPYQRIIDASPDPERFYNHLKFIPKEEVHVFFSAADLVCLPYAAASQSGVTAIAMHYHKPVVATDVGGLKEYFDGNPIGHICAPKDVHALTKAIREALRAEPVEAATVASWNARFSWAAFVQKCLSA
jgi:glycosyltransferase involved in cell wall biosynthesis